MPPAFLPSPAGFAGKTLVGLWLALPLVPGGILSESFSRSSSAMFPELGSLVFANVCFYAVISFIAIGVVTLHFNREVTRRALVRTAVSRPTPLCTRLRSEFESISVAWYGLVAKGGGGIARGSLPGERSHEAKSILRSRQIDFSETEERSSGLLMQQQDKTIYRVRRPTSLCAFCYRRLAVSLGI
jgi:hypothetical protein